MSHEVTNEWSHVKPGQKQWISRNFRTRGGREFEVTVGVVRGAKDGPTFANVGGQHGMEHAGPIVLREVFEQLDPANIRGTMLICPCANPLALELNHEVYPEREEHLLPPPGEADLDTTLFKWEKREDLGDYNMNRMWPDDIANPLPPAGKDEGFVGQVTRWLWQVMIAPADFVVDHHCVRDTRMPYIFCEEPSVPWAPWLDLDGVWCTGPLAPEPTAYPYRRLGLQSIRHGKVGLIVEYSLQRGIRETDRAAGHALVLNAMRGLGMIDGEPRITRPVWLIPGPYWEHLQEIKSQHVGHIHWCAMDYEVMTKGQSICHIHDVQSNRRLETIAAPANGLLLHSTWRALARRDQWICRFTTEAKLLAEPGKPYHAPPLPLA